MTFTLELTEEQAAIQELVASLAMEVVDPAARDAERDGNVPEPVRKTLHATGLVTPVAAEYGGDGVPDALTRLMITEGLAYGDPGIAISVLWNGLVPVIIGACGTDQLRADHLPDFVRNASFGAGLALYEGYGRAPSEFQTTITTTSGRVLVQGRKLAVQTPSAGGPLLVVGTKPDGTLAAALLDPADPGITMTACGTHLGLDAVATATVDIDTEVDATRLLGHVGADADKLARQVTLARLSMAAAAVGSARRAVDYAAAYAKERIAFGRPISTFQGVAFLVAEGHMRVQAAWLQLRQTLEVVESATEAAAHERDVAHAVGYATTIASEVTRDCVQVLGGHGFLTDHPVERWYRSTAGLATLDLDPTTQAFAPAL